MVTVNTFDLFSPLSLSFIFKPLKFRLQALISIHFFNLLLKHEVGSNTIYTLIELICCFGLMKLKNVSAVTVMSIAENTNFVNMLILSTYLSGIKIKLVFVCYELFIK